jgi:cell division protein FtsB
VNSRAVAALLIGLLAVVQAQLWLGRGSIGDVAHLRQKLDEQKARNALAQQANDRLGAEVRDLQEGLDMVEERARIELGMVKPNEILVQIVK